MHEVASFLLPNFFNKLEGGVNVVRQDHLGTILTASLDANGTRVHDHNDFGGRADSPCRESRSYCMITGADRRNAGFKLLCIEAEHRG
jgi:hypothetical protein